MNLPDGSVRIVVSGEQVILEKFLAMVYMCPRAIVRDVTVTPVESRDFSEFSIVRE